MKNIETVVFLASLIAIGSVVLGDYFYKSAQVGRQFTPSEPVAEIIQKYQKTDANTLMVELTKTCQLNNECPTWAECDIMEFRYCEITGLR